MECRQIDFEISLHHLKKGESINIGNDVAVRTNGMYSEQVKQHIEKLLNKCPGTIYGQMHQLFARTKYGDADYTKRGF